MTTPLFYNIAKTKSFYPIKCPRVFNDVRETTDEIPPWTTLKQNSCFKDFLFTSLYWLRQIHKVSRPLLIVSQKKSHKKGKCYLSSNFSNSLCFYLVKTIVRLSLSQLGSSTALDLGWLHESILLIVANDL